jgi:nucleoside-triphosphatase
MKLRNVKVFLSGRPGSGKTTVFMKTVELLKRAGVVVGGIISPEVRVGGRRIGFNIIDLSTGDVGVMARLCSYRDSPLRIGRYCVYEEEVLRVGLRALKRALMEADIIAVDEIGPMEVKVRGLKDALMEAIGSGKPLLAVIHYRLINDYALRLRPDAVYEVTPENRGILHQKLINLFTYVRQDF